MEIGDLMVSFGDQRITTEGQLKGTRCFQLCYDMVRNRHRQSVLSMGMLLMPPGRDFPSRVSTNDVIRGCRPIQAPC
jgi:hypothetical protein